MAGFEHLVSISGGKGLTATYPAALDRRERTGRPLRALVEDTGNENPITTADGRGPWT